MKRLDEITIADLMPDSISGDAQVSATAGAIDPQLRLISEAVDRPLILAAIDDLSAGVLEHLAVQYDVTSWDSAWPIETKRAVLKTAIADKRKMGTRGAVQRAIEAVAPIATLTEWWQDTNGDMLPHTFKIDLLQDGSAVDPETQANVISQVNEAKPVRSHYTFTAIQKGESGLYFAGVLRAISYARVRSAGISIEQTSIDAGVLAALRGMSIRRLLASSHMGEMPEPVVPDTTLFGGDFSGNEISLDSVDGGGSVINRYNPGRALFSNTGFVEGAMITRYNPWRDLFELRGWEPGGCFWDVLGNFVIMDSTTGNVLSSVQIENTDLPIEIDVLEPSEIIDPTASTELTAYFNTSKTEIGLSINEKFPLYDESGNHIPYDSSKTYVITAGISTNQSHPSFTPEELALFSLAERVDGGNSQLAFQTGSSVPWYNGIQSIKYTES